MPTIPPLPTSLNAPLELAWDATRWELYTSMEGAEAAAQRLNLAARDAYADLTTTLAAGGTCADAAAAAYRTLRATLEREAAFGAFDTEPDYHAQRLIAQLLADRLGVPVHAGVAPVLDRIEMPVQPRRPQ